MNREGAGRKQEMNREGAGREQKVNRAGGTRYSRKLADRDRQAPKRHASCSHSTLYAMNILVF